MSCSQRPNNPDNPRNDPDFYYPDEVECIICGDLIGYDNVGNGFNYMCCFCDGSYNSVLEDE